MTFTNQCILYFFTFTLLFWNWGCIIYAIKDNFSTSAVQDLPARKVFASFERKKQAILLFSQ